MDWEEFVYYSHTWSNEVFGFVVGHLRGRPDAEDVSEALSDNDPSRHRAIMNAAEAAGTELGAAELAELVGCVTGNLRDELLKQVADSVTSYNDALEVLEVANLDADVLVGMQLSRGLRPTTEEACLLLEAADLQNCATDLVASAKGAYTFDQIVRVGSYASEDALSVALSRGIASGLHPTVEQIVELADLGAPEETLLQAIGVLAKTRGHLLPAEVVALAEYVDEQMLIIMVEATEGTFSITQARQLCELLYGDDYALACVLERTACSDERRLALMEEYGADVLDLCFDESGALKKYLDSTRLHDGGIASLLLAGAAFAGKTYMELLDSATRKSAQAPDAWGTGPEDRMGTTSWEEGSEEDDDSESWT